MLTPRHTWPLGNVCNRARLGSPVQSAMTSDGLSARGLGLDAWGRLRAPSDRCGFAEAGRRARPDRRCRSVWRVWNSLLDGFQVLVERFRIALFDAVLNHREPIGLEIPRTRVAIERGLLVDVGPSHQVVEVASRGPLVFSAIYDGKNRAWNAVQGLQRLDYAALSVGPPGAWKRRPIRPRPHRVARVFGAVCDGSSCSA